LYEPQDMSSSGIGFTAIGHGSIGVIDAKRTSRD
jgi:hypothetical protein